MGISWGDYYDCCSFSLILINSKRSGSAQIQVTFEEEEELRVQGKV